MRRPRKLLCSRRWPASFHRPVSSAPGRPLPIPHARWVESAALWRHLCRPRVFPLAVRASSVSRCTALRTLATSRSRSATPLLVGPVAARARELGEPADICRHFQIEVQQVVVYQFGNDARQRFQVVRAMFPVLQLRGGRHRFQCVFQRLVGVHPDDAFTPVQGYGVLQRLQIFLRVPQPQRGFGPFVRFNRSVRFVAGGSVSHNRPFNGDAALQLLRALR